MGTQIMTTLKQRWYQPEVPQVGFEGCAVKRRMETSGMALLLGLFFLTNLRASAASEAAKALSSQDSVAVASANPDPDPRALGLTFVDGSTSTLIVERGGKKYLVNLMTHGIKEVSDAADPAAALSPEPSPKPPSRQAVAANPPTQKPTPSVYEAGDDFVFSLPTGRRLERHGFYVNFNHRFVFNPAFSGKARGHVLLGLDDIAVSSFGFRYGLTKKAFVGIYRSPSLVGRPIQLSAGYNFLDEHDGNPFNAVFRFSVEGQNDFSRNYTTDFEGIFSRSVADKAQIYLVPTVSLHNRPVIPPSGRIEDAWPFQPCSNSVAAGVGGSSDIRPCANTFSLGVAGSVDIRPSVALIAEVIPTLVNGRELGIHRPAYALGIQKKIWRHAFTFGFSTSPGTTVSQRAGTRATYLGAPSADTPGGLFVGFDLTRQIF